MFLWKLQQKADAVEQGGIRDRFHGLRCKCWQHVWDLTLELFALVLFAAAEWVQPESANSSMLVSTLKGLQLFLLQMVKFCRPKTFFLKILFSFEYLVLRCSTENYGFSLFCFWSFVLILNYVGATVLGFLFNLMKYIIHPYIAPNPSILINFFKDFILYPLTLIKKFHWLLAISHCVCLGPDSPRGSIIELPIEVSEAGKVRLNFQTCKPSCWTQRCREAPLQHLAWSGEKHLLKGA